MIKAIALENVWLNFSDETKAAFKKNKAYQFQFKKEEELTESDFLETEVLVGLPKPDLLAKYKNLKWLQLLSWNQWLYSRSKFSSRGSFDKCNRNLWTYDF